MSDAFRISRALTSPDEIFERAEAQADAITPQGPVVLLRYRSPYDWRGGAGGRPDADYLAAYTETDALAAALTLRGRVVHGVTFENAFRSWVKPRSDSPEERQAWAAEQLAGNVGSLYTFTLGDRLAVDPISDEVREAMRDSLKLMGWARYAPRAL